MSNFLSDLPENKNSPLDLIVSDNFDIVLAKHRGIRFAVIDSSGRRRAGASQQIIAEEWRRTYLASSQEVDHPERSLKDSVIFDIDKL